MFPLNKKKVKKSPSTNLRLVTNDVDAARVDKGDDAVRVVTRQELRRDRQAVHIHGDGRAGHLREAQTRHSAIWGNV